MPEPVIWKKYTPTQAFLVALDISGFSNDLDPGQLLSHRMNFFNAVDETSLFAAAKDQEAAKVHFLGDELRLAFHTGIRGREVRDFVDDVFAGLERINKRALEPYHTKIKGVVFSGPVIWKNWHNCDYLNGMLPIKAQIWMERLAPQEVAIDELFRNSLQIEGIPTNDFLQREFLGELGYLLRR